tara:strand:- start:88 stop:339 length:252 start_codon:yes stop_codon:yes gene_type:complete
MAETNEAVKYVINKGFSNTYRIVQHLLEQESPKTSLEVANGLGLDRSITGRRLPELANRGVVKRQPSRECTVSKRKAITWSAF